MGLAISVGLFDFVAGDEEGVAHYRAELDRINEVLVENGVPAHVEPDSVEHPTYRGYVQSFPYSFIHYLRRAIAYQLNDESLTEVPNGSDPTEDPILEEEYYMLSSHIICHSDCDGYYVPAEFGEPIGDHRMTIGSSQKVLAELKEVAPTLGIELTDGALSDAQAESLSKIMDDGPFYRERIVWFTLWESASLSVDQNAVIVFH